MAVPNYMSERLYVPQELEVQLTSEEFEMTIVHRYMEYNGWDFPGPDDDKGDYDVAVYDVKWFVRQLLDLARGEVRQ